MSAPWSSVSDGDTHTAYLEKQRDRISLQLDGDVDNRVAEGAPGVVDSDRLGQNDLFMGEKEREVGASYVVLVHSTVCGSFA